MFYHLPMNTLIGRTSVNPSGLDANIDGSNGLPKSVRGPEGNAIRIRGRREWLHVTGPGHRYECFGDLEKCYNGNSYVLSRNATNATKLYKWFVMQFFKIARFLQVRGHIISWICFN